MLFVPLLKVRFEKDDCIVKMEYLKVFIDLAETLNFTQTAKNVNLTQSAISQIVRSLEGELDVILFNRTNRRVVLTDSGIIFYNDIQSVIRKYDLAVERTQKANDQSQNALTIGYTGTDFELRYISEMIKRFNSTHIKPRFNLLSSNHNVLKEKLQSFDCDLIFQTEDSIEKLPDIAFTPLIFGHFICALPNNHYLARRKVVTMQNMKNETIIFLDNQFCPPKQATLQKEIKRLCPDAKYLIADSLLICHTMLKSGLGISVLPDMIISADNEITVKPFMNDTTLCYGLAYLKSSQKKLINPFLKTAQHISDLYQA